MIIEEVSIWRGFRALYNEAIDYNKKTLREVFIEDKRYIYPLDALKVRFELEIWWRNFRMLQPAKRHLLRDVVVLDFNEDKSVLRVGTSTK